MQRIPEVDVVTKELKYHGLKYSIEENGAHIKIRWYHNNKPRVVIAAKTGSDIRGPLNNRAQVRRMLREDGFDVDVTPKPRPVVAQLRDAFVPPEPVDPLPQRVEALEAEIKVLTDILMDICPAFDQTAHILRETTATTYYDLSLRIGSGSLGAVLGALFSVGLRPAEVGVQPVGVTLPDNSARASTPQPKKRGGRGSDHPIIKALQQHPMDYHELTRVCNYANARSTSAALWKLQKDGRVQQAGDHLWALVIIEQPQP